MINTKIITQKENCGRNIHPFTSDKLSSSLALNVWLGILPRPSVTFTSNCSMLLQAPVTEKQQNTVKQNTYEICKHSNHYLIYSFSRQSLALLSMVIWHLETFFHKILAGQIYSHTGNKIFSLWPNVFCNYYIKCTCTPCSSSRAIWTRALFLELFIRAWSLSWQAFRLVSMLADGPSSLNLSQYQSQPCRSHPTTPSRARQRPMHSSAFPWQL